jgi:hypothetical protein
MQTGAENRPKLIAAIVLGVLALVLLGHWLFAGPPSGAASAAKSTAPAEAPAAVEPGRAAPARGKAARKKSISIASLDPTLHFDWLKKSEDTKYQGTGRNIFRAQMDIPAPIASGATDHKKQAPAPPPGPPPPPPIELKFYGFASKPGQPKRIFLAKGEDIFIASEGDIVDRRYKIVRISPVSVEIEDVLNNNRQEIPLTQG